MRHGKHTFKIGRTASHRRCMIANMLKALIEHGRIETTVTKAKELKRHADKMITLAKKNTLASRRRAAADLMVTFNTLTPKQARAKKAGKSTDMLNNDRQVVGKLFGELSQRFAARQGGYTRIVRLGMRAGDNAPSCLLEYLAE
ncbi:MAG TPA: 50S ribosomal protein L17 [Rhabdochlamydiaceae bacterium]|nr:50S ribosomal protein L17 [Rhabdochlamydiaceae bacterium]